MQASKLSIAISTLALLAACGGGGGDGNTPSSNGSSAPSNAATKAASFTYLDYNAAAGLAASPWSATFVDNDPATGTPTLAQSGWSGQLHYGTASSANTVTASNTALAGVSGIAFGAPVKQNFDPAWAVGGAPQGTQKDANLDGAYELCAAAPNGSQSTTGYVSTDVLITADATPVTQVSELANETFKFNQYCSSATASGNETLLFDAQGNATFNVYTGSSNAGSTSAVPVPAAAFQAALNGTPYGDSQQGQIVWSAYKYVSASGQTRLVIVERGTADGNYVGLWY
ncbi:hypothetical protein [Paraburkholderia pallida]|uniref:HmuY protein n=1 Tax=Paraburkholderia pallida TaxID=2547399 RepID=A0A4P7CZ52_9BURK|nr:hypothetical protein [Paraburkholderia pallida]QBQ99514.1 hypothetical protein E1956_20270 [Paraburkholderia pallida]